MRARGAGTGWGGAAPLEQDKGWANGAGGCTQAAKEQRAALCQEKLTLSICLIDCDTLLAPACPCLPPTGEVKAELISILTDMVQRHQQARAQVTDAVVDAFMAVRPMAP